MGSTKKHEKKSKKKHKHKTKESKHKSKKLSKKDKQRSPKASCSTANVSDTDGGFEIPVELMNSKSHAPITPEEYQRKQKEIRRVTDSSTGRTRLIRGDGEVLEEIVSKKRHAEINKAATMGDGEFFQEQTVRSSSKKTK